MNSETNRADEKARERLFDVLLREECGGHDVDRTAAELLRATPAEREAARGRAEAAEPAIAGLATRGWMVAAALLAIGVVVATMQSRVQPVAIVVQTPQEPQGGRETRPRDQAHFLELFATAKALHVGCSEPVGSTRQVTATGASDQLDSVMWKEIVRIDGAPLSAWREQFAASGQRTEPSNSVGTLLPVCVELADGSIVNGVFTVDAVTNFMLSGSTVAIRANAGLQALVDGVRTELERRHRLAVGTVRAVEELAALPADSKRIECPWFADGKMGEQLARFPSLETFVLATGPVGGLDAAGLRELVAKKTLTSLDLRAAELEPRELAPLAELPALTTLAVRGAVAGSLVAQFAPNLVQLTLERSRMSGADGFYLRGCKRLKVLQLVDCEIASSASWVEIVSLPSLTQLIVRQRERSEKLFGALQLCKLQSLRLVDMPVTGGDLAMLAELPTLRELAVLAPTIDDGEAGSLAALKQLTTLRLMNVAVTKDGLADLQKALPKCAIDCVPGRRLFDSASWLVR